MADFGYWKDALGGHGRSWLDRETRNGAWITAVIHSLYGIDIYREEFSDNIRIRYGMNPLDPPKECDGRSKRFMEDHTLLCPQVGIVMEWHNDAVKEWGDLGYWGLTPKYILY